MRYVLKIEYDGTSYKGWQSQKNQKTVQGILEQKLEILLREKIILFGAGRTDAGVHAQGQIAHFNTTNKLNENKIKYSLNCLLKNENIIVNKINKATESFHARFSCKMKEYNYKILIGNRHNIFLNKRYWLLPKFDVPLAQNCANLLLGTHDFSSFRDRNCQSKTTIKTINLCKFSQKNNLINLKICAKSFLHHQIRIIVGTIFEIISKNKNPNKMLEIISKKDRKFAGPTAPARGLFLTKIFY